MSLEQFVNNLLGKAADFGFKLLFAAIVLVIGRTLIKWAVKLLSKSKFAKNNDATVMRVLLNFTSAALYILLAVTIVAILGVPMASMVALIASAGVAIGLALQGALGNDGYRQKNIKRR